MYHNFISRHFSNQSGIIVLANGPHAHCGVHHLTEASSPGPDSPRTSPRNETLQQYRSQMTVANSPVQWPSWWWNHSWHSSRVTLNQHCFTFIRPRTLLVYRYHAISRTQSHSAVLVAPHRDEWTACRCLTVEQLLYWSDWIWTGRAAQLDAKTKFRFRNIIPKQLTLSWFVQHTSANSMYKDDNTISQQQKVLHMNKMLERVTHFQTTFSVGIQPLY